MAYHLKCIYLALGNSDITALALIGSAVLLKKIIYIFYSFLNAYSFSFQRRSVTIFFFCYSVRVRTSVKMFLLSVYQMGKLVLASFSPVTATQREEKLKNRHGRVNGVLKSGTKCLLTTRPYVVCIFNFFFLTYIGELSSK